MQFIFLSGAVFVAIAFYSLYWTHVETYTTHNHKHLLWGEAWSIVGRGETTCSLLTLSECNWFVNDWLGKEGGYLAT